MSEKEPAHVTVRILEKEYFVSCPQDERADLLDSAEYLNKKMREIRDTGKVVGADRIAVMAALNMANELLRLRKHEGEMNAVTGRVKQMRERVESALQRTRQLDLENISRMGQREKLQTYVAFLQGSWCRVRPALPAVFDSGSGYLSAVM